MQAFKIIEHTADLRLQVFGHNYEELFQNAVLGLNSILINEVLKKTYYKKPPAGFEKIKVEGLDINALLVNFLNEILTQAQINKKIYTRIKFLRFGEKLLEAQIFGVLVDGFDKDIKAVTYHQVEIKKNKRNIFEATLTLDI